MRKIKYEVRKYIDILTDENMICICVYYKDMLMYIQYPNELHPVESNINYLKNYMYFFKLRTYFIKRKLKKHAKFLKT